MQSNRDITIDFLRGLCLPLMMIDHLRGHWLSALSDRPLGFFPIAAVFVLLSGFAVGRQYEGARRTWRRALQVYGLHLSASAVAVSLATYTPLGREIEIAVANPAKALLDAALLRPGVPLLDFLPMYIVFLAAAPLLMSCFKAGQEKAVLGLSFVLWLAYSWAGWQFLFLSSLYLGYVQRTQPLQKPVGVKGLNLGLFGTIVAMAVLRHSGVLTETGLGPLAVVNLYLCVAFLWLVPAPLMRMVRQGRLFIAVGHNALAVCAWQVLVFYAFMSWFPAMSQLTMMDQALVVSFAVVCLVYPVVAAMHFLEPVALQGARDEASPWAGQ
jgi:hypothetical protein